MRIATAAYPLDWLSSWQAYEAKIERWVRDAADGGAQLAVFPEYGAMELATLDGRETARDLEASARAVSAHIAQSDALFTRLAAQHNLHILTPSAPVYDADVHSDRPVNRTRLIAPNGKSGAQDKQIMTLFERDPWAIAPGGPLMVFDTDLGKIGVLICYDSEFPLLGRALVEAGVDYILVPSCTEALAGYWRVRIGAMARALEGQCVTVMSSLVGPADWSEAVEMNTGAGGVFGPPDTGFPPTGVLAEGALDVSGWTFADADRSQIAHVRTHGIVRNAAHWSERAPEGRGLTTTYCDLR